MHLLYDSDTFVVLHLSAAARPQDKNRQPLLQHDGFEIVDKRTGKEVFLAGAWAELFRSEIGPSWSPAEAKEGHIEAVLERYASLAQCPVIPH